ASGCSTTANSCTGNSLVPVVYNIMNYSSCPNRFTVGQKERMVFSLLNYRSGLLDSYGTLDAGDTLPSSDIAPPVAAACTPNGITNSGNSYNMGPQNILFADINYISSGYTGDNNQFYIDHTVDASTCLYSAP